MAKSYSFDRGLDFTELAREFEAYCRSEKLSPAKVISSYSSKSLPPRQRIKYDDFLRFLR